MRQKLFQSGVLISKGGRYLKVEDSNSISANKNIPKAVQLFPKKIVFIKNGIY